MIRTWNRINIGIDARNVLLSALTHTGSTGSSADCTTAQHRSNTTAYTINRNERGGDRVSTTQTNRQGSLQTCATHSSDDKQQSTLLEDIPFRQSLCWSCAAPEFRCMVIRSLYTCQHHRTRQQRGDEVVMQTDSSHMCHNAAINKSEAQTPRTDARM
mgnify:CR=1 FL=1